ncbi:MAG: hypothetical protein EB084_12285 [Proteobacteria bacterium]|nr:hypothetical protein [Pseudomonadota bacterium]
MPTARDERIGQTTEMQRQARRESFLHDVQARLEGVNRAFEHELPENTLAMAHELRDYIASINSDNDEALTAEQRKVERIIDKLESAGYKLSTGNEGIRQASRALSRATRNLIIGLIALLILAGLGVRALLKANDEENARIPGRIVGVVGYDTPQGTVRVPFENVRLVAQNEASDALANKLGGLHDRTRAFHDLRTKRGSLPAIGEGTLSPVGEFALENVPPGRYYVIVITSKNEDEAGAWMIPLRVEPTKITEVKLVEGNRF